MSLESKIDTIHQKDIIINELKEIKYTKLKCLIGGLAGIWGFVCSALYNNYQNNPQEKLNFGYFASSVLTMSSLCWGSVSTIDYKDLRKSFTNYVKANNIELTNDEKKWLI